MATELKWSKEFREWKYLDIDRNKRCRNNVFQLLLMT